MNDRPLANAGAYYGPGREKWELSEQDIIAADNEREERLEAARERAAETNAERAELNLNALGPEQQQWETSVQESIANSVSAAGERLQAAKMTRDERLAAAIADNLRASGVPSAPEPPEPRSDFDEAENPDPQAQAALEAWLDSDEPDPDEYQEYEDED